VKIILSLSLATRTVLVALVAGFVLGAIVGYQAGESSGDFQRPAGPADDPRASSPIADVVLTGTSVPEEAVGLRSWQTP
jgi:hypothetical protein